MYLSKTCKCRLKSRYLGFLLVFAVLATIAFQNYLKGQRNNKISFIDSNAKRAVTKKDVRVPEVRTKQVTCKAIIDDNRSEINRTLRFLNVTKKIYLTSGYYIRKTKNCPEFLNERRYITEAVTREEAEFPIAYSIMIYKHVEQFERLLRAVYRPQNYYCIHADAKSPRSFHLAVQGIVKCFSNVFIASRLLKVKWGQFTALEADIICMRDLWKRYKDWKYFINLTGQEFPLRTNNELVKILISYNGTADIKNLELFANGRKKVKDRIRYKYRGKKRTNEKLKPLPYNLTLTKGECHVVLPKPFVDYLFQSWIARNFLEWLRLTLIPDETYLPTLNNSPQLNIPGSYSGSRPKYARYKNWQYKVIMPCHGKVTRGICINGIGDLHFITQQPHFFVNKFHLNFQYLTLDCMEEWFYNRTRAYYAGEKVFDVSPYEYNVNPN